MCYVVCYSDDWEAHATSKDFLWKVFKRLNKHIKCNMTAKPGATEWTYLGMDRKLSIDKEGNRSILLNMPNYIDKLQQQFAHLVNDRRVHIPVPAGLHTSIKDPTPSGENPESLKTPLLRLYGSLLWSYRSCFHSLESAR